MSFLFFMVIETLGAVVAPGPGDPVGVPGGPASPAQGRQDPSELLEGLLPMPQETHLLEGRYLLVRQAWVRYGDATCAPSAARLAARLGAFSKDDPSLPPRTIAVGEGAPAEAPDHPEGYAIRITSRGITSQGHDEVGVFRAEQTLESLLDDPLYAGRLPCVLIRDWPQASCRAAQIDLTGEASLSPGRLRGWIEQMARLRINKLVLRLDARFGFEGLRVAARGTLSKAEVRDLSRFAAEHQISLVPQVDLLDGMAGMLVGPYEALRVCASENVINPRHPAARPFLEQIVDEVCPIFEARWFHAGFALAPAALVTPANRQGVTQITLPDAERMLVRHLRMVREILAARDRQLAVWSDAVLAGMPELESAGLLDGLVVFVRRERPDADLSAITGRLVRRGAEVVLTARALPPVDSGSGAWLRLEDEIGSALSQGALGGCVLVDVNSSRPSVETSWCGVGRAAARLWNLRPLDSDSFERRFARAFFGVDRAGLTRILISLEKPGIDVREWLGEPVTELVTRMRGPRAIERLDRWSEEIASDVRAFRRRLAADRALARRNPESLQAIDLSLRILEHLAARWSAPKRAAESWREAMRLQSAGRDEWMAAARAGLADMGQLLDGAEQLREPLRRGVARLAVGPSTLEGLERSIRDLEALVERVGSAVSAGTGGVVLPSAAALGLTGRGLRRVGQWDLPEPGAALPDQTLTWDVTRWFVEAGAHGVVFEAVRGDALPAVKWVRLVGARAKGGEIRVVGDDAGPGCWTFGVVDPKDAPVWRVEIGIGSGRQDSTGSVYLVGN